VGSLAVEKVLTEVYVNFHLDIIITEIPNVDRIRKFLGLPDPDTSLCVYVIVCTDPNPDPTIIKKKVRETLISTVL
jgi:hypothetical protein